MSSVPTASSARDKDIRWRTDWNLFYDCRPGPSQIYDFRSNELIPFPCPPGHVYVYNEYRQTAAALTPEEEGVFDRNAKLPMDAIVARMKPVAHCI